MLFTNNKSLQQTTMIRNTKSTFLVIQIKCEYTAFFHIQQYPIKNTTTFQLKNNWECILIQKRTQKKQSYRIYPLYFSNLFITMASTSYCKLSTEFR